MTLFVRCLVLRRDRERRQPFQNVSANGSEIGRFHSPPPASATCRWSRKGYGGEVSSCQAGEYAWISYKWLKIQCNEENEGERKTKGGARCISSSKAGATQVSIDYEDSTAVEECTRRGMKHQNLGIISPKVSQNFLGRSRSAVLERTGVVEPLRSLSPARLSTNSIMADQYPCCTHVSSTFPFSSRNMFTRNKDDSL